MLVKLAGGLEIDLATGAELAGHTEALSGLLGKEPPRPLYLPLAASIAGTGTVATISMGAPPAGRMWNVLAVTFMGNNDHGSVASPVGNCAMYFGDPFNVSLGMAQFVKIALPSTVFPAGDALWCPAGQQVFFVTDAAVNAPDSVTIACMVAEWRSVDVVQATGR